MKEYTNQEKLDIIINKLKQGNTTIRRIANDLNMNDLVLFSYISGYKETPDILIRKLVETYNMNEEELYGVNMVKNLTI